MNRPSCMQSNTECGQLCERAGLRSLASPWFPPCWLATCMGAQVCAVRSKGGMPTAGGLARGASSVMKSLAPSRAGGSK